MSEDGDRWMEDDTPDAWMLCRADVETLDDLLCELKTWISKTLSGTELIALGAVIAYIEAVLGREEPCGGVRIGWTMRPNMMEGVSVDIAISDEGIELGKTEFVPTGQGNSCDHACSIYAHLNSDGGFKTGQVERWLELVTAMRGDLAQFDHEITWLSYEG